MIVIRFSRVGRKNKPQFRLVVQEHTTAPTGRHIEIVGSWDPHHKKGVFKNERIQYWLSQGAQASDSVHNLLVEQKVIDDKKRAIKIKKAEAEVKEGEEKTEAGDDKKVEAPVEEKKEEAKDEVKEEKVEEKEAPKEEEAK